MNKLRMYVVKEGDDVEIPASEILFIHRSRTGNINDIKECLELWVLEDDGK